MQSATSTPASSSGGKKFSCSYCEFGTDRIGSFTIHLKTHTGQANTTPGGGRSGNAGAAAARKSPATPVSAVATPKQNLVTTATAAASPKKRGPAPTATTSSPAKDSQTLQPHKKRGRPSATSKLAATTPSPTAAAAITPFLATPKGRPGRKRKVQEIQIAKQDILADWSDNEEKDEEDQGEGQGQEKSDDELPEEVEEGPAPALKKPRSMKDMNDVFEALLQSTRPPDFNSIANSPPESEVKAAKGTNESSLTDTPQTESESDDIPSPPHSDLSDTEDGKIIQTLDSIKKEEKAPDADTTADKPKEEVKLVKEEVKVTVKEEVKVKEERKPEVAKKTEVKEEILAKKTKVEPQKSEVTVPAPVLAKKTAAVAPAKEQVIVAKKTPVAATVGQKSHPPPEVTSRSKPAIVTRRKSSTGETSVAATTVAAAPGTISKPAQVQKNGSVDGNKINPMVKTAPAQLSFGETLAALNNIPSKPSSSHKSVPANVAPTASSLLASSRQARKSQSEQQTTAAVKGQTSTATSTRTGSETKVYSMSSKKSGEIPGKTAATAQTPAVPVPAPILATKSPPKPTAAIKPSVPVPVGSGQGQGQGAADEEPIIRQALQGTLKNSTSEKAEKEKPEHTAEKVVHLLPVENADGTVTYMLIQLDETSELRLDTVNGVGAPVSTAPDAMFIDQATDVRKIISGVAKPQSVTTHASSAPAHAPTSTVVSTNNHQQKPSGSKTAPAHMPSNSVSVAHTLPQKQQPVAVVATEQQKYVVQQQQQTLTAATDQQEQEQLGGATEVQGQGQGQGQFLEQTPLEYFVGEDELLQQAVQGQGVDEEVVGHEGGEGEVEGSYDFEQFGQGGENQIFVMQEDGTLIDPATLGLDLQQFMQQQQQQQQN